MALFTEATLRAIGSQAANRRSRTADALIKEEASDLAKAHRTFDVFLSHSIKESNVIWGVKTVLEGQGLTVYVDWIVDPAMDRSRVTPQTAETLRTRMRQSKSLVYAHSNNSTSSKWMPWELGFFDGFNGNIVVFPVAQQADETFKAQEFLGLYPYIDKSDDLVWVNKGDASRRNFGKSGAYGEFKAARDWWREKASAAL